MPNIPMVFSTVQLILCAGKSQFPFLILVCVGKGVLRCRSSTHRSVRPHLTLWVRWQGSPAVSCRSTSSHCMPHSSMLRSGRQALLSCVMSSLVTALMNELYSSTVMSIYSYNYSVMTVMNCLGEEGYRISGKLHKLGSLCGYPLLFPPVGLEFFSSRNFECCEGRKNSLISPLPFGHFKTSSSSCTVSPFSSMAWVITYLTTPRAMTNCVCRSIQQEGDFFLRAVEKFSR